MASSPTESFPFPYQPVFDAAAQVLPSVGITLVYADPARGLVQGKTGWNFLTYGENITITLWMIDAQWTGVQISSVLKFGLFDWGRNQRNILRINVAMSQYLDAYAPHLRAPLAPPPPPTNH